MKDTIKQLGIALGKNLFHACGMDENGNVVLRKKLSRQKLHDFLQELPAPCLIGMEACGGAHYWTRLASRQGHEVRMMAPVFVKP